MESNPNEKKIIENSPETLTNDSSASSVSTCRNEQSGISSGSFSQNDLVVIDELNKKIDQKIKEIESLILFQEFEEGMITRAERYVISLFRENCNLLKNVIVRMISDAFTENNNEKLGMMFILLANLPYSLIKDELNLIIIFLKSREDTLNSFSVEHFIRIFEIWEDPEAILLLDQVHTEIDWLKKYKDEVIKEISNAHGNLPKKD